MTTSDVTPKVIPGGLLVALEGGEGAGKTTRAEMLKTRLESAGYQVVLTHEPGATALGQKLRTILLDPTHSLDFIVGFEILMLFAADLHAALRQIVSPALAAGSIVIADRYASSSTVYQTLAGVDPKIIDQVNEWSTNGLIPTRTYWLDVTPEIGLERLKLQHRSETTKYDIAPIDFHRQVRAGFAKLQTQQPDVFVRIDADQPAATVLDAVYNDLSQLVAEQN